MTAPSPLISRYHADILSLQPRDKATMWGVSKKELSSRRIYMKVEVTSQRREMLLFLTTKIAAVTSPANQKYNGSLFITSAEREVKDSRCSGMYQSCHFLTRLSKQSLYVFGSIRLFDEVRAELVQDISRSLRFL